jgi:uncharacterized protein
MDERQQTYVNEMIPLVIIIAKALVNTPAEVSVSHRSGDQTVVIELRVGKKDLGQVIGKHGRTADALRTIVRAVSTRHQVRSVLDILE